MKRIPFFLSACAVAILLCSNAICQRLIATVNLGSSALPFTVAVNPDTNKAYAVSPSDATVSVVDGNTNTHLTDIALGTTFPAAIAVNRRMNRIYVCNEGGFETRVSVIDGSNDTLLENVSGFLNPLGIAVNPVTNTVYVTNSDGSVGVMDGATDTIITTIPSALSPAVGGIGIAVDAVTNQVYVGGQFAQYEVIDGNTNTVLATIDLPSSVVLAGMAVDATLSRLYVVDQNTYKLYVIDAVTNVVITTVSGGFVAPHYAVVTPRTHLVALQHDGGLVFISGITDQIVKRLTTTVTPQALDLNNATGRYFVALTTKQSVAVVGQ